MRIFLGGTAGSLKSPKYNRWREDIVIPTLIASGVREEDIINPIVESRTPESNAREEEAKHDPGTLLYFHITNPNTEGNEVSGQSLVEITMALYDRLGCTVVSYDTAYLSHSTSKSITRSMELLKERHPQAVIFGSLGEAIHRIVFMYHTARQ